MIECLVNFRYSLKEYVRSKPSLHKAKRKVIGKIRNFGDNICGSREIGVNDLGVKVLLSKNEREYLFKLSRGLVNFSSIVEIGCYAGGSSYFLGKGAEISKSKVFSIDLFDSLGDVGDGSNYLNKRKPSKDEVFKFLEYNSLEGIVTLVDGDSIEVARGWDKSSIDLLFIDGDHTKTKEDFYAFKPYLNSNALVLFHDSNYPGFGREDTTDDVNDLVKCNNLSLVERIDSMRLYSLN